MGHTKSCPHECQACSTKKHWFINEWKIGGCIVCGLHRGTGLWGCDFCWEKLTGLEQGTAIASAVKGMQ